MHPVLFRCRVLAFHQNKLLGSVFFFFFFWLRSFVSSLFVVFFQISSCMVSFWHIWRSPKPRLSSPSPCPSSLCGRPSSPNSSRSFFVEPVVFSRRLGTIIIVQKPFRTKNVTFAWQVPWECGNRWAPVSKQLVPSTTTLHRDRK